MKVKKFKVCHRPSTVTLAAHACRGLIRATKVLLTPTRWLLIFIYFMFINLEHTTVGVMGEGETNNIDCSMSPVINTK